MDDVGASSKRYEVYSKRSWRFGKLNVSGNWLFLKYLTPFKAWGPYRELDADEWRAILEILRQYGAKLTVAITATWAESQSRLIPFPERFQKEARTIKDGVEFGLLEVANHGLTHSVIENNAFKPRLFAGNREFHREFGPQVSASIQRTHLRKSQEILQEWLGSEVVTFVPPGNLFTEDTLGLAAEVGLKYVSCQAPVDTQAPLVIIGNEGVQAFHDRDIVLQGTGWLRTSLEMNKANDFMFVRELGEAMVNGH